MNTFLNVMFNLYVSSTFLALASVVLYYSKFARIVQVYELKDMTLDPVAYFLVLASSFVPILNFPIGMKYFQIGVLYTDAEFVQGMYACTEGDEDNDGQGN